MQVGAGTLSFSSAHLGLGTVPLKVWFLALAHLRNSCAQWAYLRTPKLLTRVLMCFLAAGAPYHCFRFNKHTSHGIRLTYAIVLDQWMNITPSTTGTSAELLARSLCTIPFGKGSARPVENC
ncbi:hypothetical protein EDB19DRAFT_1729752 [Suillus lakei]|nr:hypothetical protein EDB19DRAFT_1729752 [Suillus lakei]